MLLGLGLNEVLGPTGRCLRMQPNAKSLGYLEHSGQTWIAFGAESPVKAFAAEPGILGNL